jgi:hypothetical protein
MRRDIYSYLFRRNLDGKFTAGIGGYYRLTVILCRRFYGFDCQRRYILFMVTRR